MSILPPVLFHIWRHDTDLGTALVVDHEVVTVDVPWPGSIVCSDEVLSDGPQAHTQRLADGILGGIFSRGVCQI